MLHKRAVCSGKYTLTIVKKASMLTINCIIQSNFSADTFLRNAVTLEVLRDDLGAYLKVLRYVDHSMTLFDYLLIINYLSLQVSND